MIEHRRWMKLAYWLRRLACRIDMHRNVNVHGWCVSCDQEVDQH